MTSNVALGHSTGLSFFEKQSCMFKIGCPSVSIYFVCLTSLILTYGCAHPQLLNSDTPPSRHRLLLPNTENGQHRPGQPAKNHASNPSNSATSINLTGHWRVGFQANQEKLSSTFDIAQNGNSFQGGGVDDQTGNAFKIQDGRIKGAEVAFIKRYENLNNPPVRYIGRFSVLNDSSYQGPYMAGQYSANLSGGVFSGEWEAAMVASEAPAAASAPAPAENQTPIEAPAPAQPRQDRAPDLSGKWDVGFEYNFKTIHSIMFLEQDHGKLTGHGIDTSTNEKFVIAKGWYHFPHVTMIRLYPKNKRELAFKANVSNISDSDYQGPYLKGKTQGGGDWEAQLVK
jgi:hypothetical protein